MKKIELRYESGKEDLIMSMQDNRKFFTCPVCGIKPIIDITHEPNEPWDNIYIFVRCPSCGRRLKGKFNYDAEFIEKWNSGPTEGLCR